MSNQELAKCPTCKRRGSERIGVKYNVSTDTDTEFGDGVLKYEIATEPCQDKFHDRADQFVNLREPLAWFATRMEIELCANDHKPGWRNDKLVDLINRLRQETLELFNAVRWPTTPTKEKASEQIIKEAADVANFAMMIADNARIARPFANDEELHKSFYASHPEPKGDPDPTEHLL